MAFLLCAPLFGGWRDGFCLNLWLFRRNVICAGSGCVLEFQVKSLFVRGVNLCYINKVLFCLSLNGTAVSFRVAPHPANTFNHSVLCCGLLGLGCIMMCEVHCRALKKPVSSPCKFFMAHDQRLLLLSNMSQYSWTGIE